MLGQRLFPIRSMVLFSVGRASFRHSVARTQYLRGWKRLDGGLDLMILGDARLKGKISLSAADV